MSKRHFEALANTLRLCLDSADSKERPGVILAMENIADVCRRFNDRFDRSRFLRAAGHPDYNDPLHLPFITKERM
jgi:hypothetical protein